MARIRRFGGAPGVRDLGAIEAALFRPQTGDYEDIVAEAAAWMESPAVNHPFRGREQAHRLCDRRRVPPYPRLAPEACAGADLCGDDADVRVGRCWISPTSIPGCGLSRSSKNEERKGPLEVPLFYCLVRRVKVGLSPASLEGAPWRRGNRRDRGSPIDAPGARGDTAAHPRQFRPELGREEDIPGSDRKPGGAESLGRPGVAGMEGVVGRSRAKKLSPRRARSDALDSALGRKGEGAEEKAVEGPKALGRERKHPPACPRTETTLGSAAAGRHPEDASGGEESAQRVQDPRPILGVPAEIAPAEDHAPGLPGNVEKGAQANAETAAREGEARVPAGLEHPDAGSGRAEGARAEGPEGARAAAAEDEKRSARERERAPRQGPGLTPPRRRPRGAPRRSGLRRPSSRWPPKAARRSRRCADRRRIPRHGARRGCA